MAVLRPQVADLNGNGLPQVYVAVQKAGSISIGRLAAFALSQGGDLSPIARKELAAVEARGDRGHDWFEVVDGCLVRPFPIAKAGDTHVKATGGERQICFQLKAGEAGWLL